MTNTWQDIKNANVVVVMGGNAAEAHPCGFKWVIEAKIENGAKLVVIDPRFTRTASVADVYVADPSRHRHRLPERRDPLPAWRRTRSSTNTCAPTPTPA